MRRRAIGLAAFAGAAVGGAALGYLAERRAVRDVTERAPHELDTPFAGAPVEVRGADGTLLHAELSGTGRAPTVVLVHGVGLSSATWHYQRVALGERATVLAYDHRGHGRSGRAASGAYDLGTLAEDLVAVVEACAPEGPVVLVGHSMGAMVVLASAGAAPRLHERVAGVALVNAASGVVIGGMLTSAAAAALGTVQARLGGTRWLNRAIDSDDPEERPSTDLSLLLTRQFGLSGDAPPAVVRFVEGQIRAIAPAVLGAYAPHLAGVRLEDEAKAVAAPTLVLVGSRDRVTLPRQGRRLVEQIPGAELVELEGVGHTAMLEAPERVSAEIERLLRVAEAEAA